MTQNLLAKRLKEIDRELTALKTAHQRPLGTLDFLQKSLGFTVNLGSFGATSIEVTVTIETPAVTPPIVQTGWSIPGNCYSVDLTSYTTSADYSQWTYTLFISTYPVLSSVNMTVTALSSQTIQSITWGYA